jgi:hypothetical protein
LKNNAAPCRNLTNARTRQQGQQWIISDIQTS